MLKIVPERSACFDINALHLQALKTHHHVELQWILAHCAMTRNAKADTAESIAHDLHGPVIPIPFSRRDASALVSKATWSFQRSMWVVAPQNHAPLHSIDPHGTFMMLDGLSKHDEAVLHHVRLNVATKLLPLQDETSCFPLLHSLWRARGLEPCIM